MRRVNKTTTKNTTTKLAKNSKTPKNSNRIIAIFLNIMSFVTKI